MPQIAFVGSWGELCGVDCVVSCVVVNCVVMVRQYKWRKCGRVLDSFVGAWGERCGELCGGGDDGEQCGELCGGEAIEVAEVRNHPRLIEGRY